MADGQRQGYGKQGEHGGTFRSRTGLNGFAIRCITALLTRHAKERNSLLSEFGAGNETRTRDPDLGKVVLYQLSYSRIGLADCLTVRTHSSDVPRPVNQKHLIR